MTPLTIENLIELWEEYLTEMNPSHAQFNEFMRWLAARQGKIKNNVE